MQPLAGVLLPTTSTNNNSNNSHNNNSNNSSDNVIVVVTSLVRNIPLAASTSAAHIQLKARLLVDVCLKKCSQMLQGLGLYPMCKVSFQTSLANLQDHEYTGVEQICGHVERISVVRDDAVMQGPV